MAATGRLRPSPHFSAATPHACPTHLRSSRSTASCCTGSHRPSSGIAPCGVRGGSARTPLTTRDRDHPWLGGQTAAAPMRSVATASATSPPSPAGHKSTAHNWQELTARHCMRLPARTRHLTHSLHASPPQQRLSSYTQQCAPPAAPPPPSAVAHLAAAALPHAHTLPRPPHCSSHAPEWLPR